MIRDLSRENFIECKSALSKQITPSDNITSSLTTAIANESSAKFVDEYVKNQYGSIKELINGRKSTVIDHQITLGKKSVYVSNDDTNGKGKLETALTDFSSAEDSISKMSASAAACFPSVNSSDIKLDDLIAVLPKDRADDIKKGNLFLSGDCKYLYYDGNAYEIYDPYLDMNSNPGASIVDPDFWQNVHTIENAETTWDWWGAIAGLNNMSSDDYAAANEDCDSDALNTFDAGFSLLKLAADARNDVSVEVKFQVGKDGSRRVIIGVTNADIQRKYNEYAGSSISALDRCGDGAAKLFWSRAAAEYYKEQTGNEVNTFKYDYDAVLSIDERHAGNGYTSTISFDENGNMQETVPVYSGDTLTIRERGSFNIFHSRDLYTTQLPGTGQVPTQYSNLFTEGMKNGFEED